MTDGAGSPRAVRGVTLAALSVLAMVWAWSRAWVCDDAFISWRYAENFAGGLGLVYNAGERVEGYSNPLWVWLCALAVRCGLDPVTFGQGLGIVCYGALVPATWWAGNRLAGRSEHGAAGDHEANAGARFLPLAAVGVALHQHLRDFSSCGLETLGFVLLVTLIVGVLARADGNRPFAIASLLCCLAAVTRPDGALVGALAGLLAVLASIRRRSLAPALAFGVPGFLLFVPFLGWRVLYYGELLPNTAYAKSAHEPYLGQGVYYLQLYFEAYWVLLPGLVAAAAFLFARRRPGLLRLGAIVLGYLAFVVWVGGDFMFARFCLPVTPLLYLALEVVARRFLRGISAWVAVLVVGLATLLFHQRPDLYVMGQSVDGVADERAQYPTERTDRIRAAGRRLGELCGDTDLRVAFSGTQAMLVYESSVRYALESVAGLTDHWLARQPVPERGIVGHERGLFSSPEITEYALRTQGVHLLLFDHPPWTGPFPWMKVELGGFTFTLVRWDREVMAPLIAAPDVQATDLDAMIDDLIAGLATRPKAEKPIVQATFSALEQVYFRWHDDPRRQAAIAAWLR